MRPSSNSISDGVTFPNDAVVTFNVAAFSGVAADVVVQSKVGEQSKRVLWIHVSTKRIWVEYPPTKRTLVVGI